MSNNEATSTLKSMTGFARVAGSTAGVDIDLEVRSVNSRYLEINLKGPRCLTAQEREVKATLQRLHRRGRIDVAVTRRAKDSTPSIERESWSQLDASVAAYTAACKRYGARGDGLAQFLGSIVLREGAVSEESSAVSEEESQLFIALVTQASQVLYGVREVEGRGLFSDVAQRVSVLERLREEISTLIAGAPARLRERLTERLAALAPEVAADPERLALEVALLADRIDVSEELSRLGIHLTQFRKTLQGHVDGVGRKLDFLTQEIGRELNTVASKAQDARVQGLVVDAKAELERIREQVQNIE
jgi:uncharacterized protein (TIGR00255 family)